MLANRQHNHWSAKLVAVMALLAILASPLILLGIAVAEQTLFGSSYSTYVYEMFGIREPIQALYEWLSPYE